jgi:hypothetical protein
MAKIERISDFPLLTAGTIAPNNYIAILCGWEVKYITTTDFCHIG